MTLTYRTNSGEMRTLAMAQIDNLAAAMRGRLARRDAADYDEARQIWNAMNAGLRG